MRYMHCAASHRPTNKCTIKIARKIAWAKNLFTAYEWNVYNVYVYTVGTNACVVCGTTNQLQMEILYYFSLFLLLLLFLFLFSYTSKCRCQLVVLAGGGGPQTHYTQYWLLSLAFCIQWMCGFSFSLVLLLFPFFFSLSHCALCMSWRVRCDSVTGAQQKSRTIHRIRKLCMQLEEIYGAFERMSMTVKRCILFHFI